MQFKTTQVDGCTTTICRAVGSPLSSTMGAGVETLEHTSFEWTLTYDEVLFIKEGSMTIRDDGREHLCEPGDMVWLPNGATLVYDASKGRCTYFYAVYPVDWAARQGIAEP
jgi:ethanolamine utilization protein EutQ